MQITGNFSLHLSFPILDFLQPDSIWAWTSNKNAHSACIC